MSGPTLLSSQGSKECAYKEHQAIWIALPNYLFFPFDYNNEAGAFIALALAAPVNFSVDGMQNWIFFQILSITETAERHFDKWYQYQQKHAIQIF